MNDSTPQTEIKPTTTTPKQEDEGDALETLSVEVQNDLMATISDPTEIESVAKIIAKALNQPEITNVEPTAVPTTKGKTAKKAKKVTAKKTAKKAKRAKAKATKTAKAKAKKVTMKKAQAPSSGQSGPAIADLDFEDLNDKEVKIMSCYSLKGEREPQTIPQLAKGAWPTNTQGKANSWTRNSLRRLVRGGLLDKLKRGSYRISIKGRNRMEKAAE